MAMMLAHRLNPSARPAQGGERPANGEQGEAEGENHQASGSANGASGGGQSGGYGAGARRGTSGGDMAQLIERLPAISVSDLKPGDAVVISGVRTDGASPGLLATTIVAGVEPILQSAPARSGGQSTGGDWGLGEITIPQ
jgi:hypothetical protein